MRGKTVNENVDGRLGRYRASSGAAVVASLVRGAANAGYNFKDPPPNRRIRGDRPPYPPALRTRGWQPDDRDCIRIITEEILKK